MTDGVYDEARQSGRWAIKFWSYDESYERFAEIHDAVVNGREEAVISRVGRKSVVVVALDDYMSLEKTVRERSQCH